MHLRSILLLCGLIPPAGLLSATGWTSEPNQSTTIEGAKAEFKSLETQQKLPAVSAKLDLPRFGNPSSVEPVPFISQLQRVKDQQKQKADKWSQNWLVDTMMKTDEKSSRNKHDPDESIEKEESLDPFKQLIKEQARDPKDKMKARPDDNAARKELKDSVTNPLNNFMSDWISSRDQKLLLRDTGGAVHQALSVSRFSDVSAVSNSPVSSNVTFNNPNAAGDLHADLLKPENNPYLKFSGGRINEPGYELKTPEVIPIPDARSNSSLINPPMAPETTLKELKPPGLANPEEDARYFPQLKRF
jgi:hypothetical protein